MKLSCGLVAVSLLALAFTPIAHGQGMPEVDRGICRNIVNVINMLPQASDKAAITAQLNSRVAFVRGLPDSQRDRIVRCIWVDAARLGFAVKALLAVSAYAEVVENVPGALATTKALFRLFDRFITQPGTAGCVQFFHNQLNRRGVTDFMEARAYALAICR